MTVHDKTESVGVRVAGTGHYLPGAPISQDGVRAFLRKYRDGLSEAAQERLLRETGILTRHFAIDVKDESKRETNTTLAAEAGRRALDAEAKRLFADFQHKRPGAYDGTLAGLRKISGRHTLHLEIAPVSFSWYLATREPSITPGWSRADPLGTTSLITTPDRHVLVSVRSLMADQNPGGLYFIGGFAEFDAGQAVADGGKRTRRLCQLPG